MTSKDPREEGIRRKFSQIVPYLNERTLRMWAAIEAKELGFGGVTMVARATGLSRTTVAAGVRELSHPGGMAGDRVRTPGAGRRRLSENDPRLIPDLDALILPVPRGDVEPPLRWTSKSTQILAQELRAKGHTISARSVSQLLREAGYSLQANQKSVESAKERPSRDQQFQWIASIAAAFLEANQPVVVVQTKNRRVLSDLNHQRIERTPSGSTETVPVEDFLGLAWDESTSYRGGLAKSEDGIGVGIDEEAALFVAENISRWWERIRQTPKGSARILYVVVDGGRAQDLVQRPWRETLQALANRTQLTLHVSRLPSGTYKWRSMDCRLVAMIRLNLGERGLRSYSVVVSGLEPNQSEVGTRALEPCHHTPDSSEIGVDDSALANVVQEAEQGGPEWNYSIKPQTFRD